MASVQYFQEASCGVLQIHIQIGVLSDEKYLALKSCVQNYHIFEKIDINAFIV